MSRLYLFFAFLLAFSCMEATPSIKDSLLNRLNQTEGDDRVELLLRLGSNRESSFDEQRAYLFEVLERTNAQPVRETAQAYDLLGRIHAQEGAMGVAMSYFNRGLEIAEGISDSSLITHLSNSSAVVAQRQGRYADAIKGLLTAEQYAEDPFLKAVILLNAAGAQAEEGRYDQALRNLETVENEFRKRGDSDNYYLNTVIRNRADIFVSMGRYDAAIELFKSTLVQTRPSKKGAVYLGLINAYLESGRLEEAVFYLDSAALSIGSVATEQARLLNLSGRISLKSGDRVGAETLIREADVLYTNAGYMKGRINNLDFLVQVYEGWKWDSVTSIYQQVFSLMDELRKEEGDLAYAEMQARFDLGKYESKLQVAYESEQVAKRNAKLMVVALSVLALIIGLLLYLNNVKRKSEAQILAQSNEILEKNRELAISSQELLESNEILEENRAEQARLNEELEFRNKELELMGHGISHDLRDPARKIHNLLQFYSDTPDQKYINEALGTSRSLIGLMDDLLRYAATGRRGGPPSPVSLRNVIDRAIQDIEVPDGTKIGIEGMDQRLAGYESELIILVQNLIKNAIKHGRKGEAEADVSVLLNREGDNVVVIVRDRGPGFPENAGTFSTHIFKPFAKGAGDGTGLGLSIAKKVVDMHDGAISAENAVGGGAQFIVKLPATAHA